MASAVNPTTAARVLVVLILLFCFTLGLSLGYTFGTFHPH